MTQSGHTGTVGSCYHPVDSQGHVMKIDGRCHCGYVTFEAEADPETTTICNCTDCQVMSGAPLRAVIITRPGTFALLSGKLTEYRKTGRQCAAAPKHSTCWPPHCCTRGVSTSSSVPQRCACPRFI